LFGKGRAAYAPVGVTLTRSRGKGDLRAQESFQTLVLFLEREQFALESEDFIFDLCKHH
jgi:hypothetical protein